MYAKNWFDLSGMIWIRTSYNLWVQQDGATCHTARETTDLLNARFDGRLISKKKYRWMASKIVQFDPVRLLSLGLRQGPCLCEPSTYDARADAGNQACHRWDRACATTKLNLGTKDWKSADEVAVGIWQILYFIFNGKFSTPITNKEIQAIR